MDNNSIHITIFTPTYNRASLLFNLYESLLGQTYKNFEWVVVDDGSLDNTSDLLEQWKSENRIKIKFEKQINGGKHRAINKGIKLAEGFLFFIVDSDDFLKPNSLETIIDKYTFAKQNYEIAGVAGRRQYKDGTIVGNQNFKTLVSNSIAIRYKHNVTGDLVEVYELEKFKTMLFPEFDGEKFCPEALIWNRLAVNNNLFFFNEGVYVTDYLEGALTANIIKIRRQSPKASMLYYSELEKYNIPLSQKIKANINFWRFSFTNSNSIIQNSKKVSPLLSIIGLPLGFLMAINDKRKI